MCIRDSPDREGEAISWHIVEILRDKKLLGKIPVSRVTFNAITKNAVLEAMANPREINQELVDAYLARRAIDYLVGFELSPVLWRKLPGARSAGRWQSVTPVSYTHLDVYKGQMLLWLGLKWRVNWRVIYQRRGL